MRSLVLVNLVVLFTVAAAALVYSTIWLVRTRKHRGERSMTRRELRVWARVVDVAPHRFETKRHLRERVVAKLRDPRARDRAMGISDLDSKRAARA